MNEIIEIAPRALGAPSRRGEIVETLGTEGSPHYRVRWEDGHETLFYPGEGTVIHETPARPQAGAVTKLVDALKAVGAPFEIIPHRRTTSAVAEAHALGVRPEAIGKTVVVRAGERRVRVVVPASRKLDLHKLADVTEAHAVLLTESELAEELPEYDLGAVPPFGNGEDCVIVDAALADQPSVIVEAGSHEFSLRLAPRDLIVVANARVADVAD